MIPFVDLKKQYISIKTEIDEAISSVLEETSFIGGGHVNEFNLAFAKDYGVKHCIGVANGTDAIYIVLKMLGIGSGDEVITVANSWISTSETISQCGAKPIFVDIEEDFYTIDVNKIEAAITNRTKAVIPVHIFGHPADLDSIVKLCEKHDLYLIEDSAQAHYAEYKGQRIGTFGDAATFSFYPGKNLGAYGDAGCVVTNNDALAEKCKMFANHGALVKHNHLMEGINSRLDGLQAAILKAKLPFIHDWTHKRREIAREYDEHLSGINEVVYPKVADYASHVFHLYVIRAKQRDRLKQYLNEKGISTAIHYPTPLPLLTAYKSRGFREEHFPVSSRYRDEILSLPIYPELGLDKVEYISNTIREFYIA